MKKIFYIIVFLIGIFGYSQTPLPNGARLTGATESDTLSTQTRIPILQANAGNLMNKYTTIDSIAKYITGVTNLSTTQTPTTVTINSDTGTDAPIALGDGVDAGVSINDYTNADKALVGSALQSGDNVSLLTNDSGYITKVGTPVNNQVGVWTGDGMLEGDSNFILENDSSFRRLSIGTSSTTGGFLRLYGHTSVAANSGISLQNNAGNQTNQEWWNIFPLFSGSQAGSLNFQATTGAVVGSALQLQSSTLLPLAVSATNTNINAESTGKVLVTREWIEAQGFGTGGGDVTKVGTPLANQIGVWTGDGTIEGIAGFEYDKTTATFDIGQTVGGLAKIESGGLPLFDYDVDTQDLTVTSQNFLVSNATNVNFTQATSFTVPTGTVGNEAVNFTQLEAKVDDTAYAGTWDGVTGIAPSKNAVYDKIEGLILGAGTGATPISHTFAGGEGSYDFGTTITDSNQIAYGTTTSDLVLLQEGVSYSKSGSIVTFIGFTALANDVIVYYPNVAVPDTYDASETTVDASGFVGNLSGTDTDVQTALTTIDGLSLGGGSGVVTQDEGVEIDAAATTLNFVGSGVTVTDAGAGVSTVTIPAASVDLTNDIILTNATSAANEIGTSWTFSANPYSMFLDGVNDTSSLNWNHNGTLRSLNFSTTGVFPSTTATLSLGNTGSRFSLGWFSGNVTAAGFSTGGTSSQFLKANGTVDSNSYLAAPTISQYNISRVAGISEGNGTVNFTSGSDLTYTIPVNTTTSFPLGTKILINNENTSGTGVTITPDTGVTLVGGSGVLTTGQACYVIHVTTNEWLIIRIN